MLETNRVYCEAELNYAQGEDRVPVKLPVYDGRAVRNQLDYDVHGFVLKDHESAVTDWTDAAHLDQVHGRECRELALKVTGCDRTLCYPSLVRSPSTAREHNDYAPIEFVHSDFTEDYLGMIREPGRPYRAFIEPLLEQQGLAHADLTNASRVALIQFWRNTGDVHPDFPLAMCDATTTRREDLGIILVPEYGGQKLQFETFFSFMPEVGTHRWYTFPELTDNEVIAFRTYDSQQASAGRPFWTLHSAFRDPTAYPDAPRRESVEMRVLCLWD